MRANHLGRLAAILGILGLIATAAYAYTVTQSYDAANKKYTWTVVVGANERLQDFHIAPVKKGQKLKVKTIHAPNDGTNNRTGWTQSANADSETDANANPSSVHWETADESTTGEDDQPNDNPGAPDETLTFSIDCWEKTSSGDVNFWCTNDGVPTLPTTTSGGTTPGPVATVTPTVPTLTPASMSSHVLALTSTEDASEWRLYFAASLSVPGMPETDPLGIGINTTNPIPPAYGIGAEPTMGMFNAPPSPILANASSQLMVGAAPSGYHFYMVLVGKKDGEIYLWSDPVEFTVAQ